MHPSATSIWPLKDLDRHRREVWRVGCRDKDPVHMMVALRQAKKRLIEIADNIRFEATLPFVA